MKNVVVDGFRAPAEVELFKANFSDFLLILVEADEKVRFKRRKIDDPKATIEDIRKRDMMDIKNKRMDRVFNMADIVLDNNGTQKELENKLDEIMRQLK